MASLKQRSLFFSALVVSAAAQAYVAFDSASASSVYSAGHFRAEEAIAPGSGYWCSSGQHGQSVSWTGTLDSRYKAVGVKINWAYGPGEFKILTSGDGGNFEEAACWQTPARPEVSYEETVLFDSPVDVKALTVVMRSPMPWAYFGISDVALLVEPSFPSMLVGSAASTTGEEMCVVASGSAVAMAPCLGAIAAGDGSEIFQFADGALQNAASKTCVTLANGDAIAGKMVMSACSQEAGDGRGIFELTSKGQLKLGVGDYCVVASGSALSVRDCAAAESGTGSKFFQAGVGSFDPSAALGVRYGAAMLKAAAERQSGLLAKLQEALPKLSGCRLSLAARRNFSRLTALDTRKAASKVFVAGPAADAVAEIYQAFGVDKEAVAAVISASASALSKAAAA